MKLYKSLLLISLIALFSGNQVLAVDCRAVGTVSQELEKATAVFSGKVIAEERRKITDSTDIGFGGEALFIRLKVDRWWNGSSSSEVVLRTGTVHFRGSTLRMAEDFRFLTGLSYLVYAYESNGNFITDGCGRTKVSYEADEDVKELGEGYLPEKIKSPFIK
ncbi:MAG TPA: hypothetical protein VK369_08000 [Segetibacter sp.]|nr:hypothetical protein [Segetibacter sp.]